MPMIIHIDRVLLTSAESKHFLLTYQLAAQYLLMWVYRNAKINDFQKYFDIFMVPGECRKHYRNAQDLYTARYPDRRQKSHMALKRLADRFCRFGAVKQTQVKRRSIVNENNGAALSAIATLNLHASSRQMEKKSGISSRSVLRIFHQHKFHPYRMSLHQDFYGNDFLKRVNFCNWIRRKTRTDVSFCHVLFSDETNFANTGNVNRHNMHYWANKNPGWMRTVSFQHLWFVKCCAALSAITLLVHIFLKVAWLGKFTKTFCKTLCLN